MGYLYKSIKPVIIWPDQLDGGGGRRKNANIINVRKKWENITTCYTDI